MRLKTPIYLLALAILTVAATLAQAEWKPVEGNIMTRWAKNVTPDKVLPEYPRPQMVRKEWKNLNGLWDYAIVEKDAPKPAQFQGNILVPFAAESALSGVKKTVGETNRLWYSRTFTVPKEWKGQRVLLHFDAVDWDAKVWVNDKEVAAHQGGFDPFSADITDALNGKAEQTLVVSVWDPSDQGAQPCGKQHKKPEGIWYTPVTGIWKTVWLEPVPAASIQSLKVVPDIDKGVVTISAQTTGAKDSDEVAIEVLDGTNAVVSGKAAPGKPAELKITNAKLWSVDTPFLYNLRVTLKQGDKAVDAVDSYFGMRKISLQKDEKGVQRLALNNKILFQYGPLDQGWWPDGLYTAPTDEALKFDIEMTKKMGFNMIRKHIKVEPARWYTYCDQIGIVVWQDMPSGNVSDARKKNAEEGKKAAAQFELELKRMIDNLQNYPSIIMWIPFNEGWGQYDTERITKWIKEYEPSRLVNNASGWTDMHVGDLRDHHDYPSAGKPQPEPNRADVQGEFGGLGLPVKGHVWKDDPKNWGYRTLKDTESLAADYERLMRQVHVFIGQGLAAAVYTQTTDVEVEVNGLMTYDREVFKFKPEWIAEVNNRLYQTPPVVTPLVHSSEKSDVTWRYTTAKPADGWEKPDFKDADWKEGKGVLGSKNTPGAAVRTEWTTPDIWTRRVVELPDLKGKTVELSLLHDEDAEVYINGVLAAEVKGYTTTYDSVAISAEAQKALKAGKNVIAIHCHQTQGGQCIDAGLSAIEYPKGK
jgi:hypothetical protein